MKKILAVSMLMILSVLFMSNSVSATVNYSEYKTVTSSAVRINDKGANDNFEKKIYLDEKISWYKSRGAEYIYINYSLRIDAINEGTQYVQIYNNDPDYFSSNKIHSKSFSRSKSGGYASYSATVKLSIDKFLQDKNYFYFGFDASGWGDDDWYLDDMYVTVNIDHEVYPVDYDSFDDSYYAGDVGYSKETIVYLNDGYDYDYIEYEISPSKSGSYNIYSEYTSSNLDTYGLVYEWQGIIPFDYHKFRGSDDNDGYGKNFRIELDELAANENFHVKVRPKYSTHSGSTKIVFEANYDTLNATNGGSAQLLSSSSYYGDFHKTYFSEEATLLLYKIAYKQMHEDIINAYLNYQQLGFEDAESAVMFILIEILALSSPMTATALGALELVYGFIEPNPYAFNSVVLAAAIETKCGGDAEFEDRDGEQVLVFYVNSGLLITNYLTTDSSGDVQMDVTKNRYETWTNGIITGDYFERWDLQELD